MRMHEKEASASRDVLRGRHNISQELELDFSKRAIKSEVQHVIERLIVVKARDLMG
jgi:hypothetical protein